MPDVRVLDITEYVNRANPAAPVPTILVTFMTTMGQPGTIDIPRDQANPEAIKAKVREEARRRFGTPEPITIVFAAHLAAATPQFVPRG